MKRVRSPEAQAAEQARKKIAKWRTTQRTLNKDGRVISEQQRRVPTLVPVEIPNGRTKFTTTIYDAEGLPARQFVRVEPEKAGGEAAWASLFEAMSQRFERPAPLQAPPVGLLTNADLLTTYPVGDHHLGMLSWAPETGADYDLDISQRLFLAAMDNLVERSPLTDTALIPILGDFFHYDSFKAITPEHRNLLDSDTRYPKMIEAGYKIVRRAIDLALMKHQQVWVICEIGNHDEASSVHFAIALRQIYENEPRVHVDTSPRNCHYFRFGSVLLGTTHGDKLKLPDLPLTMATDMPVEWGETQYRYWYTGHRHNDRVLEVMGIHVEQFGVLAPGDAYNRNAGYRAGRSMKAITYHKDYGEVSRLIVNPMMLEKK